MSYRIIMHYDDDSSYATHYEDLQQVRSFCKEVMRNRLGRVKEWEIYEIVREIPIEEILG